MAMTRTELEPYTEMNNNNFSGSLATIPSGGNRMIALRFSEGINHYSWTRTIDGDAPDEEHYEWAGNWYNPGVYFWLWWEATITNFGTSTPTLALTRSSGNHGSTFICHCYENVDQTAKVTDSYKDDNAGTSITATCNTDVQSGDIMLSALNDCYGSLTYTGSGTDFDTGSNSVNGNGYDHSFTDKDSTSTSVSDSWSSTEGGNAIISLVIREAAAAVGSTPLRHRILMLPHLRM